MSVPLVERDICWYLVFKGYRRIRSNMSTRDNETPNLNWSEVIKKEARGQNKEDLGEVQEVGQNYVLVQRGHDK